MKILVLGYRGMLGSTLYRKLVEQWGVECVLGHSVRINSVFDYVREFDDGKVLSGYDIVFNCIGAIPQKQPTTEELIWNNITLPMLLSRDCKKVVHFSTDCIFSGKTGQYSSDSEDWATDMYGWTKRMGEVYDQNVVVIRTSIIGHRGPKGLLEWFLNGTHTEVGGYVNHFWNGCTTNELAFLICNNFNFFLNGRGLLQLGGQRVSKYELLCMVADVYGVSTVIKKVECPQTVDKSLLPNHKYFSVFKPLIMQLAEMRQEEQRWGTIK